MKIPSVILDEQELDSKVDSIYQQMLEDKKYEDNLYAMNQIDSILNNQEEPFDFLYATESGDQWVYTGCHYKNLTTNFSNTHDVIIEAMEMK